MPSTQTTVFGSVPVFEEPPEPKGDELEKGLDDEEDREDVVAVRQSLVKVLQNRETLF